MPIRQLIKKTFNFLGFDIMRLIQSPEISLLGLKRLNINTIIDVGANEGQFAKTILKFFPNAHLYCFEPLSEPFTKLKLWADKQKNQKITTYNFALGDREGTIEMFSHVEHSPSSSILKNTKLCEEYYPITHKKTLTSIKVTTLDSWLENSLIHHLPKEVLIKLDVQGYEDRVIRGGAKIYTMAKACILEVNLDQLYDKQATFKDISLLLFNFGYRYAGNLSQSYANDGHVIYIDALFLKQ